MNRLPRRPASVQPPLRGRAAAIPPSGSPSTPLASQRLRLPTAAGRPTVVSVEVEAPCQQFHPFWHHLFERSPGLLFVVSNPWRILGLLFLLLFSAYLLGRVI